MTADERIARWAAEYDRLVALISAGFAETVAAAPWDHDDRIAVVELWRSAWAAERAAVLGRLREDGRP